MTAPARFDFGLDEIGEQRATALHETSIVLDMLSMQAGGAIFDTFAPRLKRRFRQDMASAEQRHRLAAAIHWPFEAALRGESDLLRDWLLMSGVTCGAYDLDLIIDPASLDPLSSPWERHLRRYEAIPWLRIVTTADEIKSAKRDGAFALYANYQPVIPVLRSLEPFELAHRKGLRSFMLTYNRMDHVGVGCTERVDAGLSMFGVDVVARCNELGIVVDVSHCGPLTSIDACRMSRRPITASHTGAAALYPHPRNKRDDVLRAVADTGGVIGICAVPYFLSPEPDAGIDSMLDHIDYVSQLVGWRHVGIGTDWPIQAPDDVLLQTLGAPGYSDLVGWGRLRRDVTQKLVGFTDCRDWPNITRGLVARGYNDEQVRGILGENALRVFGDAWS